ncbi:calmin-like isoform X2 [Pseudoliparis swirei]|uniref:calmin-like isoform X2 n=1 Tax=Pseudoliparis swirei TaxID=2059687 RepID=UPI0024BD5DA3|nr:calmin-like isoform X2 [Pseudoliparis swirei]
MDRFVVCSKTLESEPMGQFLTLRLNGNMASSILLPSLSGGEDNPTPASPQIKELTGNIRSQFPSSSSLSSIPTGSDGDAPRGGTPPDEKPAAAMREHSRAIKRLLQWVQKRTRRYSVAVRDFGKSWTSGLAFLAVIKSIDPSLVDMRKALLRTAKENLEDGFRIAHFSLGIPRLLEPEDVTMNAPDEQSIMTYVSQFLAHFPGIEEPEGPVQPVERSVSMGRLNRDGDSNPMRDNIHRSRVKERAFMFQRLCTQPPPKILISSVSEDRGAASPPFRPAAARSWSSVDILADPVSGSVVQEPEDLTSSTSDSLRASGTHSPTGSSAPESVSTESVIGDSAISSPDSWGGSEFGAVPERFGESRSDGSLCDSGAAWDVYRATPVEVTPLDEGCVLSTEERAAEDEQPMTEPYPDEGIYSLSSSENTQEKSQRHFENKQPEVVKEKEANREEDDQDTAVEPQQTPPVGLSNAGGEHPHGADPPDQLQLKQTAVEESAGGLVGGAGQHVGHAAGPTERQNEGGDAVETHNKVVEGVLRDDLHAPESLSSETRANTRPTNQEAASGAGLDPGPGISIPRIAVSSEPEEPDEEGICDPERRDDADEAHRPEGPDTDLDCPQNPHELDGDSNDNVELPSCLGSEDNKPAASQQMGATERGHMAAAEGPLHTEKDLAPQTSSPRATSQQEIGPDTARPQQNPLEPVHSDSNGTTGLWADAPGGVSGDLDQRPPSEEAGGDPIEPMDLFYPDQEELALGEPPDTEMQSWPSVLSVSALQPAPASETQPDQTLSRPGKDFRNGLDPIQENDEETDRASRSQEPGEKTGEGSEAEQPSPGRAGENTEPVRADAEGSGRPDESQIPPVLRHRKGARVTDHPDNHTSPTAATRRADHGDSDVCESWELYVLLLLWLLLYCCWLLPQMDLKTLPGLLLNLEP